MPPLNAVQDTEWPLSLGDLHPSSLQALQQCVKYLEPCLSGLIFGWHLPSVIPYCSLHVMHGIAPEIALTKFGGSTTSLGSKTSSSENLTE